MSAVIEQIARNAKSYSTQSKLLLVAIFVVAFGSYLLFPSNSKPKRPPITDKVPLTRVTGKVLVDGVPTAGVQVHYAPQVEIAEKRERYRNRFFLQSGDGGKFSLSTYVNGDGIPFGEYALEFKWMEQRLSGEVDRFGGRYSYPAPPLMKIQVNNKSIDLGEIRLETKKTTARD